MYTYGYIKNAILTKLNLTEKEALEQNLLDTFIYNINECLSQIAARTTMNELAFLIANIIKEMDENNYCKKDEMLRNIDNYLKS